MAPPQAQSEPWTGGCQCGAIRFRSKRLGRASLCHCRMCQKAMGSIGGLFVTAHDLTWTRGAPKHFRSSGAVRRGFCSDCGSPLTFEYKTSVDVAIAAFDRAAAIPPVIQMELDSRLPWGDMLADLPLHPLEERAAVAARLAKVKSFQHPDHDTTAWQPANAPRTIRAMPVLGTSDMQRSLAFYRDKIGFVAATWGEPPSFAILQRGTVTIALAAADKPAVSHHWAAYVYVSDADALFKELTGAGIVIHDPPTTQPYNCRDFVVDDPDGHMIAFGQVVTPDPLGPGLSVNLGRDG